MTNDSDEQLVRQSIEGEQAAFEKLVQRHQVLVCSIAYSIVGNIASSEDIGQEAFLMAWKRLSELREPKQFKSWLSTIARNQARMALRRRTNLEQGLEEPSQIPQISEHEPMDQEEVDLVWKTLQQLPESYREPLILYYRQDQSVSEVATTLSLSQSATKQRLARGREMLRGEVLATIEQSLRKSAPTAAFSLGVMAVISGSSKTAAAATAVAATNVAATAAKGAGGAVAGPLLGLMGGFFGAFNSWYHAEYQSQRMLIVRQLVAYLLGTAVFLIPIIAIQLGWQPSVSLGQRGYAIAFATWMLGFLGLNCAWMYFGIRGHRKLALKERAANAQRLPRYEKAANEGFKVNGRRWTSSKHLFGLPLVQVANPDFYVGIDQPTIAKQGTARAWIAIGHFAHGRIFAMGHRAIAPVAIGTFAVGFISCGVLSVGVISTGVLCIAPIAIGVAAFGGVGIGCGLAAGFIAVAPMAFAIKAAKGAMAFSFNYAEGAVAFAPNANNEAARDFMASSTIISRAHNWMERIAQMNAGDSSTAYWIGGILLAIFLVRKIASALVDRISG